MPSKGMRSLLFSPKSSSVSSPSSSASGSPSRFGFLPWRSYSEMATNRSIELAEPVIMKWNTDKSTAAIVGATLFSDDNHREAVEFVRCVRSLKKAMRLIEMEEGTGSDKMIRAENLMKIAMRRLQKEFYAILSTNRANLDPESISARSSRTSFASRLSISDYEEEDDDSASAAVDEAIAEVDDDSTKAVADLKIIAECMISSGYGEECLNIYKAIRKSIVDEGVYKLGVERFSSSQIQKMDWKTLDLRIRNWTNAVATAVKTLFNGERILSDHVFANGDQIRESCFTDVVKDGAVILFSFPEKVAKHSKKKAERAFRSLDMYAAMANVWPEIESIFSSKSTSSIKSQAISSLVKLGEFTRAAVDDFESSILNDSSKKAAAGAGIHQLTIDSMDYLTYLADYSTILPDILTESHPNWKKSLPESYFKYFEPDDQSPEAPPPTSMKMAWLILTVLCKLDTKASHHKDVSLSYLFLANNLQYIIGKVRTSNLRYLLGEEWITKHEARVKQYASNYQRLGWNDVVESITAGATSPEKVREGFQKFNSSFNKAYSKHSSCVVPDNKLRDHIKASIANRVFHLYREFYNANVRMVMEKERYPAAIVRYAPEDVGHHLSDLFFGGESVVVSGSWWSSSSVESSPSSNSHHRLSSKNGGGPLVFSD